MNPASKKPLTIGQLAKRAGVSTSRLRFYEKEQLLLPVGRTPSGYRLYAPESERDLQFIRRAQRYGFSLNDIKMIVGAGEDVPGNDLEVMKIAEQRFVEIERRLTEMLVLRHELELFLDDLADHVERRAGGSVAGYYHDLVQQICGHEHAGRERSSPHKLVERIHCNLAQAEWDEVFADVRGHHFHIWREDDGYSILFSPADKKLRQALERLAAGESDCEAHLEPDVSAEDGGVKFTARGENAFLFAQLFLSLESEKA